MPKESERAMAIVFAFREAPREPAGHMTLAVNQWTGSRRLIWHGSPTLSDAHLAEFMSRLVGTTMMLTEALAARPTNQLGSGWLHDVAERAAEGSALTVVNVVDIGRFDPEMWSGAYDRDLLWDLITSTAGLNEDFEGLG